LDIVKEEARNIKRNDISHDKPFLVTIPKSKNLTQVKESIIENDIGENKT